MDKVKAFLKRLFRHWECNCRRGHIQRVNGDFIFCCHDCGRMVTIPKRIRNGQS